MEGSQQDRKVKIVGFGHALTDLQFYQKERKADLPGMAPS